MLAWWTLIAATVAAIGSILGPLVAYRAAIRTIDARSAEAAAERRQADIDRAVDLAVGDNPRGAQVGVSVLDLLVGQNDLTETQERAAYSALTAALDENDDNGDVETEVDDDGADSDP